MPGKESDSGRNNASASDSVKAQTEGEVAFEWDSSRDSPQDWNRDRGESMRSGSGRSVASLGGKGDTGSLAESTSSAGNGSVEVAKEAKEKKEKSSWVKTIGMRTLRLRKKDPEKSQSRMSIASALGSLERPSKSKNKADKLSKGDEQLATTSGAPTAILGKPGEHVKDSDSIYSAASSKNGSVTRDIMGGSIPPNATAGENADKQDPARFLGDGLLFKGKLIGVLEVSGPRGDRICQEALSELKMAVKAAGEHKQKITIHIALDGLRIRDEKTGDCLYHHQVHKISFIAQDLTDARAFGYIFGSPDTGHRFFGIKTEKSASQVVIAMRDLFQVVFDLKKKEIERAKQQLEMQQKFLATRAAETAPTTKTEPKFSIAETYIEGAGAVGGVPSNTPTTSSAHAEVDLLNLEVELNSLQEGLDNIHTNLDSVPFRGSTASISSDPMNPMPKLSTGSMASNASNPTPVSSSATGDPFGDSFDPFDSGATPTPTFAASTRYHIKSVLSDQSLPLGPQHTSHSNNSTPLTFTSDPFAQVDPFPGHKYHGDGDFFSSDPFDSPSGQFSFAFPQDPNAKQSTRSHNSVEKVEENVYDMNTPKYMEETEKEKYSTKSAALKEKPYDGWVASFEDDFVPDTEANGLDEKSEVDIFTDLDPLGTGRIRPFVDRKDFFHDLKHPPKKNLNDLVPPESITPHSSSSSLVVDGMVNPPSVALSVHACPVELTPPKFQSQDISSIPNSFSTNFTSQADLDSLPIKTPPTSVSSRTSSIRMRLHSENSRSESPPNYSPPPPPHNNLQFSSTSSIGSVGLTVATNSEYMSGTQLPILPPPSSVLGTPPSARFLAKKSPQLLKQMTIGGSTVSSPKTLPRPSSGRERKLTSDSHSSIGMDDIPNLTPPPRPPHTYGSTVVGKSISLTTAVPRPSSGSDRLRNLSGMSSLSGTITPAPVGAVPPEPPPRPIQTTLPSNNLSQQLSPSLMSPPPPLPPKKQTFGSLQTSPLSLFSSKNAPSSELKIAPPKVASDSNDLPLPLPSRKAQYSSASQHVLGRYSVPLPSMSPSTHRKKDVEARLSSSSVCSDVVRPPPVIKLTMEQALHQVASLSLGDLANKLELPVTKLSSLTIQQLAEKLTLMDFEQRMEQKERELYDDSASENTVPPSPGKGSSFNMGFEDDFSTASAPGGFEHNAKNSQKEEFDKYAVFRELSIEDASGFSVIGNVNSGSGRMSDFSANSEDEDLSIKMDKTLTNKDSSSERTIQAEGEESYSMNKDASFATAMANTMDDITDANLSDDDAKFPFDDEDNSPGAIFNAKPNEWATFESNFEDQFAAAELVKPEQVEGNQSPWDSEEEVEKSVKASPVSTPSHAPADKFDFEPFQKPPQLPTTNYSLTESASAAGPVPPVPERRRPSQENGSRQNQPLSPDLLRSPVSQFQRQSSGSSKHSARSIEEPSIGRGSDYAEPSHRRRGSNDEGWERDRDRESYRRRESGYRRSDSKDSYSSIPRSKYRDRGESEEEYVPSRSSARRGRHVRPSSSKRSSEREGEPEDEREEEEDTKSYASYHSTYSSSGHRKHRRFPPKYHHCHYSSGQRRKDRERVPQAAGSGHSSLSPERYSHHESDFDDSCDENGATRKKDYYARERDYAERHYYRSRPCSGTGYPGKRCSRDSPKHPEPYYRDRYYRGDRPRRKFDDEYEDGREFSDYSGEDEHYHGRHSHRRRRGRDDYYRDRERDPRHHYYTNSPSWDSESGPEPGDKSEKSHRPSSAKYANDHGMRYSPATVSSSSRPTSGRRDSSGKHRYDQPGNGQHHKRGSGKIKEYRCDDEFNGDAFAGNSEPVERQGEYFADLNVNLEAKDFLDNIKYRSPSLSETMTPDPKVSQPQSPFEDNFVKISTTNGVGDEDPGSEGEEKVEYGVEKEKKGQSQIFFPTKFESEGEFGEGEDEAKRGDGDKEFEERGRESGNEEDMGTASSPDVSYTPPTSANSLRGNFSVYSTKRLESIRSEEEKSNEDSVSESALTNASNIANMKKSDSFNIFKPSQDPFADDDFFK